MAPAHAQSAASKNYGPGPFISDVRVITALDCREKSCTRTLSFSELIRPIFKSMQLTSTPGTNPLNYWEAEVIRDTIEADLEEIADKYKAKDFRISDRFLTHPESRIELVGVINRMDRQFLGARFAASSCGEISLIYRFWYSIRNGDQKSRLPITMNLVFPASTVKLDCQTAAQRWLTALARVAAITDTTTDAEIEKIRDELLDSKTGALAEIVAENIKRIELNVQAYRRPARVVNDFGSEARYVIRVFTWDSGKGQFVVDVLPNQIDREKILCGSSSCKKRKADLVAYLTDPEVLESIDRGTLNIRPELNVLATRAISLSPGGARRSANQPYWSARRVNDPQDVITNAQIRSAIAAARKAGKTLDYVNSTSDFRTRLNDSTCTGCHQTRAIAGFHFPGEDREGTQRANSVFLPGSPHFYGDQPRRLEMVKAIADGSFSEKMLETSYSARPHKRFETALKGTQLIGGWGGECLLDTGHGHKRDWGCRAGLECVQLFESRNDLDAGTCMPPKDKMQIGDPLQRGRIDQAIKFEKDGYSRLEPLNSQKGDTRIPDSALPPMAPPKRYYGAHQEFFAGCLPNVDCKDVVPESQRTECYKQRRDALTGGFPAGMLRLSECTGIPGEATCGLVASSGFNTCVAKIGSAGYTIDTCFVHFTSYSAMRACDRANPCRDDYICLQPIIYGSTTWQDRRDSITMGGFFKDVNERPYDPGDFGQAKPDKAWERRPDRERKGICIPPYFVFQFRSDKHGEPPTPSPVPRSLASTFPFPCKK
jgi:hypothetical protein